MSHRLPSDLLVHPLDEYNRSGSEAAFRRMVELWMPLVMGTALRHTGGQRELAEDAAQEVFVDLASRAKKLRSATLAGWLHRHTCFTVSRKMRTDRRRRRRERHSFPENGNAVMPEESGLDDLLLNMPAADREALLLHYVEGRTHEEVAEMLGLSRAAAQKRCERALDRLRLLFHGGAAPAVAAMLAPPVAEGAAASVTAAAWEAAGGARRLAFFQHPVAGSLTGAAAAAALAAAPLVSAWREFTALPAPAVASAPGAGTSNAAPAPLSDAALYSPGSPSAAVTALLEFPARYGLGTAASERAIALIAALPRAWIHEVAVELSRRVPADCGDWHASLGSALSQRWQPQRIPEDWREATKAIPRADSTAMFLICAETDRDATLRWFRSGGAAEVPAEARVAFALKHAPDLLATLVDEAPQITWVHDYEFYGLNDVRSAAKDEATRPLLLEQLAGVKDGRRRVMLERLVMLHEPDAASCARIEAMDDAEARAWAATAAARPNEAGLRWWEQQVPHERQPELGTLLAESYLRPEFMLPWMERMGESSGGPEFDRLRFLAAWQHSRRDGTDYAAVATIASRITDPELRIALLGHIISRGYDKGSWKHPWLEQHLSPEEQRNFSRLLPAPRR